jgi:hypothetical protein
LKTAVSFRDTVQTVLTFQGKEVSGREKREREGHMRTGVAAPNINAPKGIFTSSQLNQRRINQVILIVFSSK